MKKYFKFVLVVIILIVLPSSFIFAAGGQETATQNPIKVGFIAALSGSLATYGEEQVNGAKLAEIDINNAGGILGRPMELVIKDTKAFVDEHPAELVDELVQKDEVLFIAGATADSVGWTARERAIYRNIPFLGFVPGDSMATRGENLHPGVISTYTDTEVTAWCAIGYLFSHDLVPKNAVTIGPDYEWGWANAQAVKKPIEAFGGKVIDDIFTAVAATKFDTIVAQIKSIMPEGGTIYSSHFGVDLYQLIHEVYVAGLLDRGYAFVKNSVYGPISYGIMPQKEIEGIWVVQDYYPYSPDDEMNMKWIERYYEEYGILPGYYALSEYLLLTAAAKAINNANSLDPDAWIPELLGKVITDTMVTDKEYMFQELTGRLLWPMVMMRGKSPEDMTDIYPSIDKVGAEMDKFEIVYSFDADYQNAIVPREAIINGTEIGGNGIGDAVLGYWK